MLRKTSVGPAVLVLLLAPAMAQAWGGENNETACERTAEVMVKACRNDVRDDCLTTVANCINISDWEERRSCYQEAGRGADARSQAEWLLAHDPDHAEAARLLLAEVD